MVILKPKRMHRFNLFGYNFLIWAKSNRTTSDSDTCKIVKHNGYIALAMPDGTVIPYQTDLTINAPLNACATAQIEVFVSIDDSTAK